MWHQLTSLDYVLSAHVFISLVAHVHLTVPGNCLVVWHPVNHWISMLLRPAIGLRWSTHSWGSSPSRVIRTVVFVHHTPIATTTVQVLPPFTLGSTLEPHSAPCMLAQLSSHAPPGILPCPLRAPFASCSRWSLPNFQATAHVPPPCSCTPIGPSFFHKTHLSLAEAHSSESAAHSCCCYPWVPAGAVLAKTVYS